VTPFGDIVATPLRGAWTGNRGRLHSDREIVRFHASDLWITCVLEFRGWWDEQWRPNRFTWLFFHDEAVSFAAGHRPCALCRRGEYDSYRHGWADQLGGDVPSAKEINSRLHGERIVRGTHRRRFHPMAWATLPDGVFVHLDDTPWLVRGGQLVSWSVDGYGNRRPRPRDGSAVVITPPSTVAVLRSGYAVQIDPSAA
jgi:hypothetical protein